MTRTGPILRGLWLGTMISLVSGCALMPAPDPTRPPAEPTRRTQQTPEISLPTESGIPSYHGPAEPDLTAERIWSSTGDIEPSVVALLEGGVVLAGPERPAYLVGTDGRVRWRLPKQLKLSEKVTAASVYLGIPAVPDRAGTVIAGAYTWDRCRANLNQCDDQDQIASPEYGVTGISTIDGSPIWSTVLVPSVLHEPGKSPELAHVSIALTTESTVLVTVTSEETDRAPAAVGTVALDATDGEKLWSVSGVEVEGSSGDKILGIALVDDDAPGPDGYPVVLDAGTGKEVWRSPYLGSWRLPGSGRPIAATAHGHAVAYTRDGDPGDPRAVVVDLATRATTPFEVGGAIGEDANGVYVAWFRFGPEDGRIMSQPLSSTTPLRSREHVPMLTVVAGVGGRLWVQAGDPGVRVVTAYDRTGGRRLKPVPGALWAVDENWLITTEDQQFTVYRLTR